MARPIRRIASACAALAALVALSPSLARAVVVSGQVTDENGFGIFNVDLDFLDRDTGQIIFTPFDNTDAGGFFSVDVPVSEYDITFDANDDQYLVREIRKVDVTGPTNLDTFLYFAQLATGHVQDELGAPLATVDLNFVDLATGDTYAANNDNTDLAGNFSVFVPELTYDIFFTPPLGMPKAGAVLHSVAIAGTTAVGTVTLPDGITVGGRVLAPGGAPVEAVDTDYTDTATGETIYSPRDDTDALGQFSVYVPSGSYDVTVRPQAVNGWAWQTIHDVDASAPVALGDIQLQPGFAVTGTIRDDALQPVAIADLDMVDALGRDLPTPDDNTDALGVFSLLPPASTFDLLARPPAGAALACAVIRNVVVTGPMNVGTMTLPAGFPISGVVRDAGGAPVAGVDWHAFELAGGLDFPTVHDNTDALGNYSFRLPAGAWRIVAEPPAGSGLLPVEFTLNPLSAPTVLDVTLFTTNVGAPELAQADGAALSAAVPNPFRATTRIAFDLPRHVGGASLTVLDAAGRRVRDFTLDGASGEGAVVWDGRDGSGRRVAAGVYFYRLRALNVDVTRKMTYLR